MLHWTPLKLPEAEQRILDLQRATMSEFVNPYSEDALSNHSSESSENTSQTSENSEGENKVKTVHSPHLRFPAINPRRMLKKNVETECSNETIKSDIKKPEEKDKAKNMYVVSKEVVEVSTELHKEDTSESTDDSDIIYEDLSDIIETCQDIPLKHINTNKLKSKLKELENVTLNIAITGMTGAGKSSFVNSLRGLPNDDERAAPTGTTETTMKANMYPHPTMPNVKIWDLPGIGSPKFRAKKYLKDVKLHTYDFFLIVTSERFRENDIELAKAIQKNKKLFYFIRTKIDNDIRAEAHKKDFDEQMLLNSIRRDCEMNLKKVGEPKVFLISSFNLEKYDFQRLINTLEEELPHNKRFALIQSLPVYSLETLTKKKMYFKKIIWLNAFAAGLGAVAPIPGLSVACDYGIMKNFFEQVYKRFGLSDESLKLLSERVNKPVEDLKAAKTSQFKYGVNEDILIDLMSKPVIVVAKVLGTIMSLFPGGGLPAGGTAIASVHYLLNVGLNEMAEDKTNILNVSELG